MLSTLQQTPALESSLLLVGVGQVEGPLAGRAEVTQLPKAVVAQQQILA